ncbi:MAG: DUF465 domain-containing protein [Gammaproteobacteria bacterium]
MSEHELHAVKTLLATEISFKRLYDKHHYLDERVNEINQGELAIDDVSLEKMKKEKLLLKDQMEKMVAEFTNNQAVA